MLPKTSRLPKEFFRGKGFRTTATPYFSLKTRPNGEKRDRIGVIVGVPVHKSAAKRNFWKRQAKAILAAREKNGTSGRPQDMILILSPKANSLTKKKFKEKLLQAL